MGSCGSIKFVEGAVVSASTVVNSTVQGSTVTDCAVNGATVTNLASLDESSAKTIFDAISGYLEAPDLQRLAQALQPYLTVETTESPSTTDGSEIPVSLAGSRDFALGRPDRWLSIGGGKVPSYN